MQIDRIPLSLNNWRCDWRDDVATGPLAQLLSIHSGEDIQELLVVHLPDDTVAISFCNDRKISDNPRTARWRAALLNEAITIAQDRDVQYARIRMPEAPGSELLMRNAGFEHVGRIDEWRRNSAPALSYDVAPADLKFCVFSADQLCGEQIVAEILQLDPEDQSEGSFLVPPVTGSVPSRQTLELPLRNVEVLLQDCLANAIDLPALPQPRDERLLRMWYLASAEISVLLALRDGRPTGILVLNHDTDPDVDAETDTETETGSPHGTGHRQQVASATIDYVGVATDQRGRGTAAMMLHFALRHVMHGRQQSTQLTAFAGSDNFPAAKFYEKQNFRIFDTQDLWIHRLTGRIGSTG